MWGEGAEEATAAFNGGIVMRHLTVFVIAFLVNLLTDGVAAAQPSVYLQFDGIDGQVEVPNYEAFSINGALTSKP